MKAGSEMIGPKATYGHDIAAEVYQKLEDALQLIQKIKANPGSDAHSDLLTASNSVWNAQHMMDRFMKGGEDRDAVEDPGENMTYIEAGL